MATTRREAWQRARRPEHKEIRRSAILVAAARLIDAHGLERAGLNAIAREAGVSKANIYRYFESREAILLDLLLDEQRRWMAALARGLSPLAGSNDPDAVAEVFVRTLIKRRRFCVLVAALAAVLERNVGEAVITEFKRTVNQRMEPVAAAIAAAIPALPPERAKRFVALTIMTASGAWPLCHRTPVVDAVLANPEFAEIRFDFETVMREHGRALLRGLIAVATAGRGGAGSSGVG